jgi:hypothetical protein
MRNRGGLRHLGEKSIPPFAFFWPLADIGKGGQIVICVTVLHFLKAALMQFCQHAMHFSPK